MIHRRIITMEGDQEWIERTIKNSLPEGVSDKFLGKGRKIMVETIVGMPSFHEVSDKKPEKRFEEK